MAEDPDTEELIEAQRRREAEEEGLAQSEPEPEEAFQHERRAEKARYLEEKLEERAESERDADSGRGD